MNRSSQNPAPIILQTSKKNYIALVFLSVIGICSGVALTLAAVAEYQANRPFLGLLGFGLFYLLLGLLVFILAPVQTSLEADPAGQELRLTRKYLIGLGGKLGRQRLVKIWNFQQIEKFEVNETGVTNIVLNWSDDSKRSYRLIIPDRQKKNVDELLQAISSRSDAPGEAASSVASEAIRDRRIVLDETAAANGLKLLKLTEQLFYIWGGIGAAAGVFNLMTAPTLETLLSEKTTVAASAVVQIVSGLFYILCGLGIRKRWVWAPWLAILTAIGERLASNELLKALRPEAAGNLFNWAGIIVIVFLALNASFLIRRLPAQDKPQS